MLPTVWIVEDERELAEIYSEYLSSDYSVKIFTDPKLALEQFDSLDAPELIISDLRMTSMQGVEFIRRIKEVRNDQKTVLVSAYSDSEDFKKALNLEVNGFLEKPFPPRSLKILVDECVHRDYQTKITQEFIKHLMEHKRLSEKILEKFTFGLGLSEDQDCRNLQELAKKIDAVILIK